MVHKQSLALVPAKPALSFSVGVTGHREANAAFGANRARIERVLDDVLERIAAAVLEIVPAKQVDIPPPVRMHSLLVDGLDQIAARQALARGWQLIAPMPFGRALNTAINAHPQNADEGRALINAALPASLETRERAGVIANLMDQATCFELADQDAAIGLLFMDKLAAPNDIGKAQAFSFAASERVALAAQVMIEQCDLIIGVWDGEATSFTGGTGHTIALALSMGAPVLWINAHAPEAWRIWYAPEELVNRREDSIDETERADALTKIAEAALLPIVGKSQSAHASHLNGDAALDAVCWRNKSHGFWHGYRRVEAMFGGKTMAERFRPLTQTYEKPDEIEVGSGRAQMEAALALPGQNAGFVGRISAEILRRFAWADGISARLSDTYRGGMILGFIFSGLAIVSGMAYLPFATSHEKWIFALVELVLLCAILSITFVGQKQRWHGRWFETRRVAEYLRHAPILLVLGVARPVGRWPKGTHTSWPETYVRHAIRDLGLPNISVSSLYLQSALKSVLLPYVQNQHAYHVGKAERLARVHHRLDQMAEFLFKLAVASVSGYLLLKLAGLFQIIDGEIAIHFSKLFTFLGVLFPTFGGAIAGIRYFGDFERFSAISDVTAQRLQAIITRAEMLLSAPVEYLNYSHVADLAHATDDAVIAEIESWQAVFSGKHITVPV